MKRIVMEFTTSLINDDLNLTELELGGKILDFHGEVEELVDNIVEEIKYGLKNDAHNITTSIVPGDIHFTVKISFDTSTAQTEDDITALVNDLGGDSFSAYVYGEEAIAYGIEPEEIAERIYSDADVVRQYELIADTLIPMVIELKHVKTIVGDAE